MLPNDNYSGLEIGVGILVSNFISFRAVIIYGNVCLEGNTGWKFSMKCGKPTCFGCKLVTGIQCDTIRYQAA